MEMIDQYSWKVSTFFKAIAEEPRISATHISLYMALCQRWNENQFQNPFPITRRDLMDQAKINGRATYHKCLKDLIECGFIEYAPSCNPAVKCMVSLNKP
jgi:hypothetical protein